MMMIEFFMPMIPPSTTFQDKELAVRNGIVDPHNLPAGRELYLA